MSQISDAVSYKIAEAAQTLKEGGVIACPTEGVFGLSARVNDVNAVQRVISIKHRALNKGLIVVASDIAMLEGTVNFAQLSQDSMRLIHEKWPGHATFIVPAHPSLPSVLTGGRNTVAVRVSAFPLLQELCRQTNCPIVSTSANISGNEPVADLDELKRVFGYVVDYILDEPCQGLSKPSTIYDAMTGAILRP